MLSKSRTLLLTSVRVGGCVCGSVFRGSSCSAVVCFSLGQSLNLPACPLPVRSSLYASFFVCFFGMYFMNENAKRRNVNKIHAYGVYVGVFEMRDIYSTHVASISANSLGVWPVEDARDVVIKLQ